MRCVYIILLLYLCSPINRGVAQSVAGKKATINLTNVTLERALSEISQGFGVQISYSDDVIPLQTIVSVHATNEDLDRVLGELFSGLNVTYKRVSGRVVLRRLPSPLSQTVRGTVVDYHTRIPIPGANVIIEETNPLRGSTSDTLGRFRITSVPVGRATVRATSVGYEAKTISNMLLSTGKELVLEIGLTELPTNISEVVITATRADQPLNEEAPVSARAFSVEETKRYAGSLGDPARMATAFPGVTGASDEGNALVVRGNSPRGVLWRIDGLEVPNPNHFSTEGASSGVISILSSNIIGNSDFLTGAFPATYGNALSAVMDLKLRPGNNERHEHSFQVGLLGLEASTEGPLSRNHRASYLVNYRYSTLNLLDHLGVDLNDVGEYRNYQDLSFKLDMPTRHGGKFSIFGISGFSKADQDVANTLNNDESGMGVVAGTFERNLSSNTSLTASLSWSGTRITNIHEVQGLSSGLLKVEDNYRKSYVRSMLQVGHKVSERLFLKSGLIYSRLFYDFYLRNLDPSNTAYQEIINFQEQDNSGITQAFITASHQIAPKLSALYGIHFLHFELARDVSVEPRAGMRWNFAPGKTLSVAYGKHGRIENLQYYLARDHQPGGDEVQINKNLGFTRANHYVVAYEQPMLESKFKVEAYFQQLYNAPVQSDPFSMYSAINEDTGFITDTLLNNGRGRNYGVEVSLERSLSRGFYYMLNATVYQSRFHIDEQAERNTVYNGNYNVHALIGREWKFRNNRSSVGLNIKVTGAGGRRYTPIDLEASIATGQQVYNWEQALVPQLPTYFRTDFQLVYHNDHERFSSEWRLDIQNVTNHRNAAYYYYDAASETIGLKYFVGIIPVLSYRIEF